MKTISIVAKKGGVGKTAIATNVAACAAADGLAVAIIDLDPQASACVWADVRDADPSVPAVPVTSIAPARLPSALEKCRAAGIELAISTQRPVPTAAYSQRPKQVTFAYCRQNRAWLT
jgi:chromosome partitioning protein